MSNLIILYKNTKRIKYFIKDCIQSKNNFDGSNCKIKGLKQHLFDFIWTDDDTEPTYDENEEINGLSKPINDIIQTQDSTKRRNINIFDYVKSIQNRENLSTFDFSDIDKFIDVNIEDLDSTKEVLKVFGRAILALCKEIDFKIK